MANLPMDLVNDLFLRLPASTLVRCRVLSKPFISLIDSPDFVASHLKRTLETGDNLMILLRGPNFLRTVYLDAPDKVTDVEDHLQSGGFTEVFGSCNGLIGLTSSPAEMALFNPSTRKIHRLPVEPVDSPELLITREYLLCGLGYDSVSQDYKVVRTVLFKTRLGDDHVVGYETKVLGLKENSWKRVSLHLEPRLLFFYLWNRVENQNGVQANNNLHWILPPRQYVTSFVTIIRFDLHSEEFGVLSFPQDFDCEENMDIGVLDGCLCLMGYTEFTHVDVWIMKEYNMEGDWSKLFRVTKPETVESFKFMRPLLYSKDRSKILLEMNFGKLVWFDLASKGFETFGLKNCDGSFSADILVSSLVLGCNGDPLRTREKKMMQKSKQRGDGFLSKGFKLKL